MKISNITNMKAVLQKYGFHFSKSLGQNFLIDSNILDKIIDAAEITKEDYVIEIGPGIGSLTQYLSESAKKVIAIELDNRLIPILEETLSPYDNVKVIHGDVLKVDLKRLIKEECEDKKVKVVANLPYYITTPIIMGLLEKEIPLSKIVVMIQKEVAERMGAKPGGKEYGALSVAVQYYTNPKLVTVVSPHCFIPQPNVDSVVIRLDVLKEPKVKVEDTDLYFKVVKAAFAQRRKTLLNSLTGGGNFGISKEEWKKIIEDLGFDERIRGETLDLQDFARITEKLSQK